MKRQWIIGGIVLIIVSCVCRVITWNTSAPAPAAALGNIALFGSLACFYLAGGLRFSLRDLERDYQNRARRSLIIGAIALVILPLALWLVYQRYYADLLRALGP